MKDTGIVRRIDELGRIVIPKEIRRTLGLKDGENMSIYLNNSEICLKKYSFLSKMETYAKTLIDIVFNIFGYHSFLFDGSKVLLSSNSLAVGENIPKLIKDCFFKLEEYESFEFENILGIDGYSYGLPVILSSDCIGYLIVSRSSKPDDNFRLFVKFMVNLIINPFDIE